MADGNLGLASTRTRESVRLRTTRLPLRRVPPRSAFGRTTDPSHELSLSTLRQQALFADLSNTQLQRVRATSRVDSLGPGQVLYERGDSAMYFYLVLEGQMNLALHSKAGEEKIVEIIGAGQVFAEAVMFLERPSYQLTAVAAMPTRVARFLSAEYVALLRESPDTCLKLLGHLSQRLHGRIRDIEHLTFESAVDRLVRMLAGRMPAGEGPAEFRLSESRQELAAFLSMKPETLSRSLRTLSERGVIVVEGRVVRVPSRARLLAQLETAG